jgi:glycine betaine/proline transport system ATP-binding protein
MPLLKVEHLSKVFGDSPEDALEFIEQRLDRSEIQEKCGQTLGIADISFELERGEILVVMGLSGSGKSTLARCMNRLIEPTSGNIILEDDDITEMSRKQLIEIRRKRIGMVFQNFGLLPHRSVLGNAEYGLEVMGVDREERRDKALHALEMVGLKGWENHGTSQLSGGMQQRVGLARALAVDPEIILMDEALSALDPLIRKDMQQEILELQEKLDKTILFITHDLDEAVVMGDRIVLLNGGYLVQEGTAAEILTNPADKYVERFVRDIDLAQVLTASSIMEDPLEVVRPEDDLNALRKKMEAAEDDYLFAVDDQEKLGGVVWRKALEEADAEASRDSVQAKAERFVSTGTHIEEITPFMTKNMGPVAVVDEEERLVGVVRLQSLLEGLARGEDNDE